MKREYIRDVVKAQGVLVATLEEQTFVSVSLPEGVSLDTAWVEVDDEAELQVNGQDAICRTPSGDVHFKLTLQPEKIDRNAGWVGAEVRGHGPGAIITLDKGHGEEMCSLAGDGMTPVDDLLERIRTSLPIGCRVNVKLGVHESVAAITHPNPTIERMGVAMMKWRGVDLVAMRRHILENGRVFGRVQINARFDASGRITMTSEYDDGAGGTIDAEMRQGHVILGLNADGVCYGHDCLILQDVTLPDTAVGAVIGRPLSDLVHLPFRHHDPLITEIDGSIGDTYVHWAHERIPLSAIV